MEKLCKGISVVAMIVIFAVSFMVTIDVVLRTVTTDMAILGTYELTEVAMVVVIFLSLAVTQTEKGHIRVEMFINVLPKRLNALIDAVIYLFMTAVSVMLAYASVLRATSDIGAGASTAVLHVPIFPFTWIMTIGVFTLTLVLLFDTIDCVIKLVGKAPPEQKSEGPAEVPIV